MLRSLFEIDLPFFELVSRVKSIPGELQAGQTNIRVLGTLPFEGELTGQPGRRAARWRSAAARWRSAAARARAGARLAGQLPFKRQSPQDANVCLSGLEFTRNRLYSADHLKK